ncbi:DNA-binding response OmpR family regulator [Bradyrhizobium japonicum]
MRLLIVGTLKGQLTTATKIAMENGATVTHAEDHEQAMRVLRGGKGADLLLVDVALDIRDLVMRLEAEHIHAPIVACGITNDARAAVAAIHAGAKEYIPLPPDPELIAAVLAAVANDSRELVYRDEAMAKVIKLAQQIAGSDASVMVTGESGTGKEVLARYVHTRSARAKRPFISINCAAIPEHLLESELFGHEKGAFTGAIARRIGKFEEATGGTLLLDEISEMDVRLQSKLLRAIQERVIDRVGGTKPVPVDIRIIATSNRNLAEAVARRHVPRGPAVPPQRRQSEDPAAARASPRHPRARPAFREEICRSQRRTGAPDLRGRAPRALHQPLAGQRPRTREHHAPLGADGAGRRDRPRRDPHPGRRPPRPRQDRAGRGACDHGRRAGDAGAGGTHRRRRRTRPDPGDAEALPRQPDPCRQHPRHLDPHAAQ